MNYIGIDIGSTAAKVCILENNPQYFTLPTGWSSIETSNIIKDKLLEMGIDVTDDNTKVVATGYGRISVSYADFNITEITCHGRGGRHLFSDNLGIIDVGGQDTKVIVLENGFVIDFLMNDKCSAGTGKFLEIMANRLALSIDDLFDLASRGNVIPISSLCTVFAESEVINYIGEGRKKEDIAAGVVDSVAQKVAQLAKRMNLPEEIIITGGLSHIDYFSQILSQKLGQRVNIVENGKYAGALGAALLAKEKKKR